LKTSIGRGSVDSYAERAYMRRPKEERKMRLYAFGPRVLGLRTGVSFGPEDFGSRGRAFGQRSVVPRAREATGSDDEFIYVLRGDHGLFKIGISRNPIARLATLRTASPFRLEMVYVAVTQGPAKRLEEAAHDALDKHRITTPGSGEEWFDCPMSYCVAAINGAACDIGQPIQAAPMNVSPEQFVTAIFKRVASGQTGQIVGPRKRGPFMRLFIYAILMPAVFVIVFLATCIIWAIIAHASVADLPAPGEGETPAQAFAWNCEVSRVDVEQYGDLGQAGRIYDRCLTYMDQTIKGWGARGASQKDLCFSTNLTIADMLDTAIEYISDNPGKANLHEAVVDALQKAYRCG
jgi:Meiotically up-regulated gene 113